MPAVQRVGDKDSAGGTILQGDSTVLVNGKAIAITDTPVTPHPPYGKSPNAHQRARTKGSLSSVTVNGKQIVVTGDTDTCGHQRVGGSPDVTIG